jgi:formylglycine-generating enzyme required for sulfatase activity
MTVPPGAASWSPPSDFDEFHLERLLGQGAMGRVYLAHDRTLERQVAVKFLIALRPGAQANETLQKEGRAIARLHHPNVMTVFRVGEVEGHPYLVSEYVEGESLDKLALPLPWRRVLSLGVKMARGLTAAHRQGVLHRDIKPSNVFLTAEGEVKLLDFGLAEIADPGSLSVSEPQRRVVGTPRYMAPELFTQSSATPRSDIYSLGLVLYELCTGELPRRRREPAARAARAPEPGGLPAAGTIPPLIGQVAGIDPEFAALIERCLHAVPGERFASAGLLCAALERLEQPHEVSTLVASNPYRGLAAFEAEHHASFFGRDADIHAVLERLRRQSLLLVAGDSGVGKSSLCRAGVLPHVTQGALGLGRDFAVLTLWPGARPLSALAAALAPVLGRPEAELGAQLAESPEQLGAALREACQEGSGLLLFVDQLEELLTLSEPAQAAGFARLLGELALPSQGLRVLLAVRGDFLTRLWSLPSLGGELERALYVLRPLTPEGLREAIVGPARGRGVVFESEETVRALLEASAQGEGSLPLVQFALAELWERREVARGLIPHAALERMGGVAGALSRHADGVLASLSQAERQLACTLLVRLVTPEGTRAELSEEEFTTGPAEVRQALRALVQGRLLYARTDGDRTRLELTHESLITSWGTLRTLLEESASQRMLRQRLAVSSGEWERAGRAEELLWGERQLREAAALETAGLAPRAQAFLSASRSTLRRRRLRRWGTAIALVLVAAAFLGGQWLREYRATRRFVGERVAAAQEALAAGRAQGERASASRKEALELFETRGPADGGEAAAQERWVSAERIWQRALEEKEQANGTYLQAEQGLEEALGRLQNEPEASRLLVALTYERLLLAEGFLQREESARVLTRMQALTRGDAEWSARLGALAELKLVTEPPGAGVELSRYVDDHGLWRREPVKEAGPLGQTPLASVRLPPGSYHLRLTHPGRAPVELPVVLARGEHARVSLTLPTEVPQGYVYIPPGCSLFGTGDSEDLRGFLHSPPRRRQCLSEGYLIGQTEVTVGQWMEYLNAQPQGAPARSLLARPRSGPDDSSLALWQGPDGRWKFSFFMGPAVQTVGESERLRYPHRTRRAEVDWRKLPLVNVSPEDAAGYFAWLGHTGRLPGARLCSEYEWERAARGADGRRYPHGDRLLPEEANIDATYGRFPGAFGPDEVGTSAASASPFGVLDMAGNALEPTVPLTSDLGELVLRGGGWYYDRVGALIANRQTGTPALRHITVGLRVCASVPSR